MKSRKLRNENPSFFRRHLRTILAIAVAALAIHDVFGPHGFLAMRRTQQEIQQYTEQMQKLDQENKQLSDQVLSLNSDPKMIERIAREDMGLAKPGELIFKLPAAPEDSKSTTPTKSH